MKGSSAIILLFLVCFLGVLFPTFYSEAVNNTVTGGESAIIAQMPLVFIVMFASALGIYALKERGG